MLIFSKLFISCLSRRIVRIESAGKGVAIGKSRAVIGWKRIAERASFVYNILIKVKLFCWKLFFQKSFYLKQDCHVKEKKFFGKKNVFLCRKKCFLAKLFFEINFFEI